MKTIEKNNNTGTTAQIHKKEEPFFTQEGQGDFFSKPKPISDPFFNPTTIQPKLTVGEPNDKYEVEADNMADKIVKGLGENSFESFSKAPTANTAQRKCSHCQQEEKIQRRKSVGPNEVEAPAPLQLKPVFESAEEFPESEVQSSSTANSIQSKCAKCEEEETIHAKFDSPDTTSMSGIETQLKEKRGGGSPLAPELKDEMETGFGVDFSGVNIHTDSTAVEMNKDLNAQAFTHGNDIYFNEGKYDTASTSGKHLLAHELTHTIQQGASSQSINKQKSFEQVPQIQKQDPINEIDEDLATSDPDGPVSDPDANQSTPSGVISFDDIEICEKRESEEDLFGFSEEIPLWSEPIPAPPPIFLLTADLSAQLDASLKGSFSYGPCMLTDIRLTYNEITGSYSGSGKFHLPSDIGLHFLASGGLKGSIAWLGLLDTFALIGTLKLLAEGTANLDLITNVALTYENGEFSFEASEDLEAKSRLAGSLDFVAAAELFGYQIWDDSWNIAEWNWDKEHTINDLIHIKYENGEWSVFTTDLTTNGFTAGELASAATTGHDGAPEETDSEHSYPLANVLAGVSMSPDSSIDPREIILALTNATIAEREAALADPITMASLQFAVGEEYWPTALAILNNEMSTEVPMLSVDAVFTIKYYIAIGEFELALQYLVEQLILLGMVDVSMAIFIYSNSDEGLFGEANTTYERDEDENLVPKGPTEITIYPIAYENVSLLLTTVLHEYKHAQQQQRLVAPGDVDRFLGDIQNNEDEVQAYLWEIENARNTGIFNYPDIMKATWGSLQDYYGRLTDILKDEYGPRYYLAREMVLQAITVGGEEGAEDDIADVIADPEELPPEPVIDTGDDDLRQRCLRGEVDRRECEIPFTEEELEIINSMGRFRNINIDPNLTGEPGGIYLGSRRIDDAPALLQFRISYNLLDRWRLYINQNEPELYGFFESEFIDGGPYLTEIMSEIKSETKKYKEKFRNLNNQDEQALVNEFQEYMIGKKQEVDKRNERAARWYQVELANRGTLLSIDEINQRVNVGGFLIWREKWLGAALAVNRILLASWPPAKQRIKNWVIRNIPGGDANSIGELNYLGSLAKGYKGPPKQYIEFYSRNFDVDADLEAPVLADYGVNERDVTVDRGSFKSEELGIPVMDSFRENVHQEMADNVFGYDENEEFEIFIHAEHTDQHKANERLENAKREIFLMRRKLLPENYQLLIEDLNQAGLLAVSENGSLDVHEKVKEQAHYDRFMGIIKQYEIRRFMRIFGPALGRLSFDDLVKINDLFSNVNEQDE